MHIGVRKPPIREPLKGGEDNIGKLGIRLGSLREVEIWYGLSAYI